jgi:transmembrane sensor
MKAMNENEISLLLEKYDDGNTSLGEEKIIHDYMMRNPTHWRASLFVAKAELRNEKSALSAITFYQRRIRTTLWYNSLPFRVAASLLLICVAVVWLFVNKDDNYISISSDYTIKQVTLPDGSNVTLNQKTTVRYLANFAGSRHFHLDNGEAFFEVVKDPDRPFTVHTGETATRVLGTSFNVNKSDDLTEVSVFSGKVAFGSTRGDSASITLTKGMAGAFNPLANEVKQLDGFDENRIAWKTHKLEFKDVPLTSVVKTLEDYFHIIIHTPDSALLTCRFRGVFVEAKLEEIVQVMDYSLNVKLIPDGSTYILSGRGCKP